MALERGSICHNFCQGISTWFAFQIAIRHLDPASCFVPLAFPLGVKGSKGAEVAWFSHGFPAIPGTTHPSSTWPRETGHTQWPSTYTNKEGMSLYACICIILCWCLFVMYFFDLLFFLSPFVLWQAADDPFLPYWNEQLSSIKHRLFPGVPLVSPVHAPTKQICQAQIFWSYTNQGQPDPFIIPSPPVLGFGIRWSRTLLQTPSPSKPFPPAFVRIPNRTWTAISSSHVGKLWSPWRHWFFMVQNCLGLKEVRPDAWGRVQWTYVPSARSRNDLFDSVMMSYFTMFPKRQKPQFTTRGQVIAAISLVWLCLVCAPLPLIGHLSWSFPPRFRGVSSGRHCYGRCLGLHECRGNQRCGEQPPKIENRGKITRHLDMNKSIW